MNEEQQEGLFGKYFIRKADGTPIASSAKYIVLRYDVDSNDFVAATVALRKYAEMISNVNPTFAADLTREMNKEYLKKLLIDTTN